MDGCVCMVDDEERRGEADRLLEIDGLPRDVGRLAFELGSAGRDADYLLNTYPGGLPDFLNSYWYTHSTPALEHRLHARSGVLDDGASGESGDLSSFG